MSLIKQLWIAIVVVTLLSLGGSLVVSTLAAKRYLEQQLNVKMARARDELQVGHADLQRQGRHLFA